MANKKINFSGTDLYENGSRLAKTSDIPTNMQGATTSAAGKAGLAPAPAAGANTKFLRGDGTWQEAGKTYTAGNNITISTSNVISATNTTYTAATSVTNISASSVTGTSANYARQDHVHGIPAEINAYQGQGYGSCSTAQTTAAKVVAISNYILRTGGIVVVRFINAVNASATLNVNSTGAKSIYYQNAAIVNNIIKAGDTVTFVYDGTRYHVISIDEGGASDVVTVSSTEPSSDTCKIWIRI